MAQTAPAPRLTAVQLHAAYKQNEVAADEKYKGKEFEIEGEVEKISKDAFDSMYLTIPTGKVLQELHASFDDSHKSELEALKPGMKVIVRGRIDGLVFGSVILKDCHLVK